MSRSKEAKKPKAQATDARSTESPAIVVRETAAQATEAEQAQKNAAQKNAAQKNEAQKNEAHHEALKNESPQHPDAQKVDPENLIRHKLFAAEKRSWARYAHIVIGRASIPGLLKYELITSIFGLLPGALGLTLRGWIYPKLFKATGKGVVFGRNLVIRSPDQITIGAHAVLDDGVLIDARGGLVKIGSEVVVNRDAMIVARAAPIEIGDHSSIGSRTNIMTSAGITMGERVAMSQRISPVATSIAFMAPEAWFSISVSELPQ